MGFLGKWTKGRLRKKLGIKKLQTSVENIEQKVSEIARQMPRSRSGFGGGMVGEENTVIGPGTNIPGAIVNETTDTLGEVNETGVVAGGTFDPSTELAAGNMFGKPIEGSFDREVGLPAEEMDPTGLETEEDLV
jgi:hypothetical protein